MMTRRSHAALLSAAFILQVWGQTHQVVRVSEPGARSPVETAVAINPVDPDNFLAVSLARRSGNRAYVSRDAGKSWRTTGVQNPDGRVQGDDAVVFDSQGVAYHSYIHFVGIRESRPQRAANGIYLRTSRDGGSTWQTPLAVVDHINTVEPFEDKPWLAVDTSPDSPHRGNLYLAWTRFDAYGDPSPECRTRIVFARSQDGGSSFDMPFAISDAAGNCRDDDDTVEGAVPSVGPEGQVYIAWAGPRGLEFDRSLDGGWTFTRDRVISDNPGGWDMPIPGLERCNGMPVTAVDLSGGRHRGSIYVNWIDQRFGDPDVFLIHSRDSGQTWSSPLRVNDDPVGNGRTQFFTWLAVDPIDGSVNAAFFDRSRTQGNLTGLTLARSTDGGLTFVNHPVAIDAFDCCDPDLFFGDYIGLAAYGGRVVATFPYPEGEKQLAIYAAVFSFGSEG